MYVQEHFAGVLSETDTGYRFVYDAQYLKLEHPVPVSLSLPLSREEYSSNVLFPFFDGLIPEGWLLETVSRNWKIDLTDRFGILLISSMDCIGDVWLEEA